MAADVSDPHVVAVFERAGLWPPTAPMLEQLHEACPGGDGYTKAVLEVSLVRGPDGSAASEALLVLMRESVTFVTYRKRGMFKSATPRATKLSLGAFRGFVEYDEDVPGAMIFVTPDPDESLLFVWKSARERERMRGALTAAKHGRFGQWGEHHLDPSSFVADFDRYYAIVAREGPGEYDGWWEWATQRFGEFDRGNALGLAVEWRRCELDDVTRPWMPSRRIARLAHPAPWADTAPDAKRVLVRLAGQLYDEGLLGPPYDERGFDPGDPVTSDAGPARLVALMRLAEHASAVGDPRAVEWAVAARRGFPTVPPSAIPPKLRAQWLQVM